MNPVNPKNPYDYNHSLFFLNGGFNYCIESRNGDSEWFRNGPNNIILKRFQNCSQMVIG